MRKLLLLLFVLSCGGPTTPDYVRPQFAKPHTGDVFRVGDVVIIEVTNGSESRLAVRIQQGETSSRLCRGENYWIPKKPGVWNFTLLDWKFLCDGYHTSGVYDRMNIFVESR